MFASSVGIPDGSRRYVRLTVTVSVILHVAAGLGLLVFSFWKISRLSPRAAEVTYFGGSLPPLGDPAPAAAAAPEVTPKKSKPKPRPDETLQPTDKTETVPEAPSAVATAQTVGTSTGSEDSTEGLGTGDRGQGVGDGPPQIEPIEVPGPPDPPPEKPRVPVQVETKVIEGLRIAGTRDIQLPDHVVAVVRANGVSQLQVATTMCTSEDGRPSSVQIDKGSGFAQVDAVIRQGMSGWRYRPWMVNGTAMRACFRVVFNYRIR